MALFVVSVAGSVADSSLHACGGSELSDLGEVPQCIIVGNTAKCRPICLLLLVALLSLFCGVDGASWSEAPPAASVKGIKKQVVQRHHTIVKGVLSTSLSLD